MRATGTSLKRLTFGRRLLKLVPVIWVSLFLFIPFLIILKISFSEAITAIPPYKSLLSWIDKTHLTISLSFDNYLTLFQNKFYARSFIKSLKIASISTICCLIIAYPMAYFISRTSPKLRTYLLLLVILPFWTSFLIRVYSWIGILNGSGLINTFLQWIGIIQEPLPLINNDFAMCVGITYSYLPFMIFPLYVSLEKIDPSILEVAYDLGCPPLMAFFKITIPLSFSGMMAGSMIVFIPALGEVVIPLLLGGVDNLMVGKVLWQEFFVNGNWPTASALAIVLLCILLIPIFLLQKSGETAERGK